MAAFDEFLRFIYATIARFIPKYTEICVREAEREREREGLEKGRQERERKRGWWRLCENMQTRATSLEASGAVWITTPPHIIVPSFWKRRGWKLIRRVQSEAKKRVGEKKRKKYRDDIASILGSCVKRDDFFLPPLFLFRPGWGEACTRWRRRDYDKGEGMESLFHHLTFSEWYRSSRGIKAAMTLLGCVLELLISWMIMGEVSWLCTVCLVYRLVLQDGN